MAQLRQLDGLGGMWPYGRTGSRRGGPHTRTVASRRLCSGRLHTARATCLSRMCVRIWLLSAADRMLVRLRFLPKSPLPLNALLAPGRHCGALNGRAARADRKECKMDDSLERDLLTPLQLLGLPHRRYSALSARLTYGHVARRLIHSPASLSRGMVCAVGGRTPSLIVGRGVLVDGRGEVYRSPLGSF
jgi:hypothetical protein